MTPPTLCGPSSSFTVIVSQLNLKTVQGGIRLVRYAEIEPRVPAFPDFKSNGRQILILFGNQR